MTKFKYFQVILDDGLDSAGIGEGFIDPREATDAAFSGTLPATLALSRDKARANLRWKLILDALKETGASDINVSLITGGDQDSPPTALTFEVVYESDKLVHAYDLITDTSGLTLFGPTGLGSGETETNTIERIIANALSVPVTKARFVFDPTLLGGKNVITKRFEDLTAANLATGATAVLRQIDLESPAAVATVTVAVRGTGGYSVADTVTVVGGTGGAATIDVDEVVPVDADTEAEYDNSPTTEGEFVGGTNYTAADIIILNDGTTVVVDTVAGNVVTEFTVDTSTTLNGQVADDIVLTQVSGTFVISAAAGFTLTLDTDNQAPFSGTVNAPGAYTALPATPNTPTGSTGSTDDATWNLVFNGTNISVTQLDI